MGQVFSNFTEFCAELKLELKQFFTGRAFHTPGYIVPHVEESIRKVRGECGRIAYHQERTREGEEYPLPRYLESWHKVSEINLAVAGESGTGKSSLLNALARGDVARTGVSETTGMPQKPCKIPVSDKDQEMGTINLWDLPGQGTMNFPAEKYIKDLGFRYYDAVILVLHNRVKEVNIRLVRLLQNHNVPVLVVVNKMDDIVESSKDDSTKRDMEETFKHIRDRYTREFKRGGCVGISLFLLSSRMIKRERTASGVGSYPINREWKAFQDALVDAVGRARGVAKSKLENEGPNPISSGAATGVQPLNQLTVRTPLGPGQGSDLS
ncbi:hypothetical protein BSKO_09703 [Bryopsis sp. KO-2023]|nr:hypothetical protein BSKO_09703 [Bryopsis sp. KO-2023]